MKIQNNQINVLVFVQFKVKKNCLIIFFILGYLNLF